MNHFRFQEVFADYFVPASAIVASLLIVIGHNKLPQLGLKHPEVLKPSMHKVDWILFVLDLFWFVSSQGVP